MIRESEQNDNENLSERFLARLQSPFELAARHVLECLQNPPEETKSQRIHTYKLQHIKDTKEHCRQQLRSNLLTDGGVMHYDRVSTVLRDSLIDFYDRVNVSLSDSERECLKTNLVMFPVGHGVDWENLLLLYYLVENSVKEYLSILPDAAIEYAIALEFFNTAVHTELAQNQFDETINQEGFDRLMNNFNYYMNFLWEAYWSAFDKPPYSANIIKLKRRASGYKFDSHQYRNFGFPPSLPDRYREVLDPQKAADTLDAYAESHRLKAQQLIDQAELDAYQQQHNLPSGTALPLQMVETLAAQSDSSEASEPEKLPQLVVPSPNRDAIAQALEPYVSSGFDSLKYLLASQAGTAPVVIQGRPMNGIAYLFRQAQESGHISNTKTDLARWLVYWFRQQDEDGQKNWEYTSVYPVLTKAKKPAKSSRIPYQL